MASPKKGGQRTKRKIITRKDINKERAALPELIGKLVKRLMEGDHEIKENSAEDRPEDIMDWVAEKAQTIMSEGRLAGNAPAGRPDIRQPRLFYGKWDDDLTHKLVGCGLRRDGLKKAKDGVTEAMLDAILQSKKELIQLFRSR